MFFTLGCGMMGSGMHGGFCGMGCGWKDEAMHHGPDKGKAHGKAMKHSCKKK